MSHLSKQIVSLKWVDVPKSWKYTSGINKLQNKQGYKECVSNVQSYAQSVCSSDKQSATNCIKIAVLFYNISKRINKEINVCMCFVWNIQIICSS
jgi:hypothetical protein